MRLLCTLTFVSLALAGSLAQAESPCAGIWYDYKSSYLRNKHWPKPYVFYDRESVASPFATMINNGWRLQNLIDEHHFKKDTSELNESGLMRVRWIVSQAPEARRIVFVSRATTPEATAARLRDVQGAAERFVVGSEIPDVRETHVVSQGWPGEYVDLINAKFKSSTKDPRLPADSGGFDTE